MVGKRKKNRRGVALAGSHQRCWLWGRNAVLETLRAERWQPFELIVAERLDPAIRSEITALAESRGIDLQKLPFDELTQRCRSTEHQGLMAKMPEFPYASLDEVTATRADSPAPPFVVVLDSIQDPHNFGAIVRSAEVLGASGVIVGERSQSDVTPHVARTSAGAVNHVPIARVDDLGAAVATLRERGFQVLGAAGEAEREIQQLDCTGPLALVIGNEGTGLSEELRGLCDELVRIPQVGRTESLNAAVAAGILCYEVRRQRSTPLPGSSGT
jgi:23S rRNA (guanosine2251-2'-O)-methyltransferase